MTLRVAQSFLKIAHLSFLMGPRGPRAYGLRPRLWLLVTLDIYSSNRNRGLTCDWLVFKYKSAKRVRNGFVSLVVSKSYLKCYN